MRILNAKHVIMEIKQNIKIAVDAIVFGYDKEGLKVLLISPKYGKFKDFWALPGGFVKDNETLIKAVKRELKEETGVKTNYLEQLYTFGDLDRDPRMRVVSVAYFGLVNPKHSVLKADTDAKDAKWFGIDNLPKLAYDHNDILTVALSRLQSKLQYQPIGFDLLNKSFPFSDLETLYQTILQKNIDRRNFRKKILSFGFLEETGEKLSIGSGRPAKLFRFNKKKYKELEEAGIQFEIN